MEGYNNRWYKQTSEEMKFSLFSMLLVTNGKNPRVLGHSITTTFNDFADPYLNLKWSHMFIWLLKL